jgi:hypothetical protein
MKPENIIKYKYLRSNEEVHVYTKEFHWWEIIVPSTLYQILAVKLECGECSIAVNYARITLLNLKTFVIQNVWVHKEKQCSQFSYYEKQF